MTTVENWSNGLHIKIRYVIMDKKYIYFNKYQGISLEQ